MTNNFQMDKKKFVVALGHCISRFGTFTVGFDKIPLSSIRLEHLFLLPIRTIMGYLYHHGIGYRSIPWGFRTKQTDRKDDDALTGLQTLRKLVTEKPVDFVGFDNVVEFNKNRQNDDNVVKAYKS